MLNFLLLYLNELEFKLNECSPNVKLLLNLQNIFNFSSIGFHNLQFTSTIVELSTLIVVLKIVFSSISEELNIFVIVSLKSNTKFKVPSYPIYLVLGLSSGLIYISVIFSFSGTVRFIKGAS